MLPHFPSSPNKSLETETTLCQYLISIMEAISYNTVQRALQQSLQ